MANSTSSGAYRKPVSKAKLKLGVPADFPLTPNMRNGQWCKKVRGVVHYFGKIADDRDGTIALQLWNEQKSDLYAGRKPRKTGGGLTVYALTQKFLTHKQELVESGEIKLRTLTEYIETGKLLDKQLGSNRVVDDLRPEDFQELRATMAKRWGPVKLGNEIQRVRSVFKFALESGLIDRPVLFGPTFKKPVAKVLRITKAAKGPTDFSAVQILAILKLASPSMKAMTLLGINGGMNNIDVATLTTKPINLDNRWLTYPRTKTGIGRKIPLWPETVAAIREALTVRRKPRSEDDAELLFISPQGKSYYRERHNKENGNETGARTDALSHEFAVLLESAKIEGHGFRDLRRTFQTIAEGCHDIVAVKAVTGHLADSRDMSEVYRQRIEDSRLIAAVNHVRAWLTTSD